jgi:hypothetical protein
VLADMPTLHYTIQNPSAGGLRFADSDCEHHVDIACRRVSPGEPPSPPSRIVAKRASPGEAGGCCAIMQLTKAVGEEWGRWAFC